MYKKRQMRSTTVYDGRILSLYRLTYPSSKIVWRITLARKVVNDYSAEEAARARYDVLKTSRDLPTADPRVEDFLEQAKSVEDNPGTPVKLHRARKRKRKKA